MSNNARLVDKCGNSPTNIFLRTEDLQYPIIKRMIYKWEDTSPQKKERKILLMKYLINTKFGSW